MRPSFNINRLVIMGNDWGVFACPHRSVYRKLSIMFMVGGLPQEMRGEVVQGKRRETRVGTVAHTEVFRWET